MLTRVRMHQAICVFCTQDFAEVGCICAAPLENLYSSLRQELQAAPLERPYRGCVLHFCRVCIQLPKRVCIQHP